ncbi:SDR family oxidoreductase [Propionimicrobium sp. PCR01-08-3]|uniref:SDR family oxidoreductase n=1 Tax=Propionimicrobium sp. PCR01-08-3 TaxID=3052086 RepID=UPI00255C2E8A|nr:SDR family oxidoreductase [Propionimicrobium sp. PCR01-08-3]WIY81847.1 SDR family oxidoreductase [Propionimicrobium sp. PCR01-08-3]
MASEQRVVILGGHGKVALLAAPKLRTAGYAVDSVIRNPEQQADVEQAGGNPVILDIESADVDRLAEAFAGASAIVFSAGAGGGNPARTNAVDYQAATRAMDAAQRAGVTRFVMVSYAGADVDLDRVDPNDSFYPYVQAKHAADAYLRDSGLDFTILGPGSLTLTPGSGEITIADPDGGINGEPAAQGRAVTSRENVASVITHVITNNAAIRETVNFYDGDTPIADAIR